VSKLFCVVNRNIIFRNIIQLGFSISHSQMCSNYIFTWKEPAFISRYLGIICYGKYLTHTVLYAKLSQLS
jgi:hypothetical protein